MERRRFKTLKAVRRIRSFPGIGHLYRSFLRCGKPSCRCAKGRPHGPYHRLYYRCWDDQANRWGQQWRYVPVTQVEAVRRFLDLAHQRQVQWSRALAELRVGGEP